MFCLLVSFPTQTPFPGWCANKSYVIATSDLWLFLHTSNLLPSLPTPLPYTWKIHDKVDYVETVVSALPCCFVIRCFCFVCFLEQCIFQVTFSSTHFNTDVIKYNLYNWIQFITIYTDEQNHSFLVRFSKEIATSSSLYCPIKKTYTVQ